MQWLATAWMIRNVLFVCEGICLPTVLKISYSVGASGYFTWGKTAWAWNYMLSSSGKIKGKTLELSGIFCPYECRRYNRINSTKSPAPGAGKVSKPRMNSQVRGVGEIVCAHSSVFLLWERWRFQCSSAFPVDTGGSNPVISFIFHSRDM
jgi:hypothetical protein